MNESLSEILANLRRRFEGLYGERLVHMLLYGSQARGDAAPDSDIDVLVVLKKPVHPGNEIAYTAEAIADLCLSYGVVIACVFMDEEQFVNRQGPFLRNVRREGVAV